METYRQTTRMNRFILHKTGPSNQPLFTMNCTISGTPINMIIKSAVARFIIKMLVTDCRIFLSNKITIITRLLPISPKVPITINNMDSNTMTSPDAGSGGKGENNEPLTSMSAPGTIPVCHSYPEVANCTISLNGLSNPLVDSNELSLSRDILFSYMFTL